MLKNKLLSAMGGVEANYIEDVFSTYLYSGSSPSSQDILNGVDLDGEGGLIWIKDRSRTANHKLVDTVRSSGQTLATNLDTFNTGEVTSPTWLSNGFSLPGYVLANETGVTYASWTFRKQPKFFDVVTYTGDGELDRILAHDLGSAPGFIVVKATSTSGDWWCWHRSLGGFEYLKLNSTNAAASTIGAPRPIGSDSTTLVVHQVSDTTTYPYWNLNANGVTYVAYLFAHDAGGFGLTGTDNVISCGSYTGSGSTNGPAIDLGWEPQWLLIKSTTSSESWVLFDSMRGLDNTTSSSGGDIRLFPNQSAAESSASGVNPSATGFFLNQVNNQFNGAQTYIYIAIRRGPMKVPTTGTSVFAPLARTGTGAAATVTGVGFPPDLVIPKAKSNNSNISTFDRLRGALRKLATTATDAEISAADTLTGFDSMDGFRVGADGTYDINFTVNYINWAFRRASGFFDVVCYTGSNGFQDLTHNLGTTPQMIIIKNRSSSQNWIVGVQGILGTGKYLVLNSTAAVVSDVNYFGSTWTPTTFLVDGNVAPINQSGSTYVAYLFATCPGVSKVGSYTGNGTSQTINCGFTGGARFVMIKRTDDTGDWYVWDTARGIVSGDDPYLLLNSTAAEVTNTDYIDTFSAGFEISSTAPAAINANGGAFIFLAIA